MLPEITRNSVQRLDLNVNVKCTNIIFRVKLGAERLILTVQQTTKTLCYFDPQLLGCLALMPE